MKKKKNIATISIRIDREILKKYKKWLIDNGYRSINQHINEVIKNLVEKDERKKSKKNKE